MIKVQNGFLIDQEFFKGEFTKKSPFYKLHDIAELLKIAYKYEQMNTVTILLKFISSKREFITIRLANIITDILASFWLNRFYAIEMHRIKNFLEATLLPKLHELLSGIDFQILKYDRDLNPQRLITYIGLMSKYRVEDERLLELCCRELGEMIKNISDSNDSLFHILKYFKVLKNFNRPFLNAFSEFRESILALEIDKIKPMNVLFVAYTLMQVELANAYQRIEFHELEGNSQFVFCSQSIDDLFEHIVPIEFYQRLLKNLERRDPSLILEQSPQFREKLDFFFRKFKQIELGSLFGRQSTGQGKSNHREDDVDEISRTSNSLVCHVRLLLDKTPDVSYTEEALVSTHKVDFFIKTKDSRQIALELDGPAHFTRAEQYSSKSIMRNLFLMREGYQVVSIRNNLLECAITNGTAENLLKSIVKSNRCGWILASIVSV